MRTCFRSSPWLFALSNKQEAHYMVGLGETPRRLIRQHCRYSLSNFDYCRPEEAGAVISCVALDYVSIDAIANFGESVLNSGRMIRLLADRTRFAHFCAVLHFAAYRKELVIS